MEAWLIVIGVVLVAIAIVGAVVFLRARRPELRPRPGPSPWSAEDEATGTRVALDLVVSDPDIPSVQRLVQEAASRALDASPQLEIVEVVDRVGTRLGEIRRVPPLRREVTIPAELHEPHQRSSRTPDPVRSDRAARGGVPVTLPERDVDLDAVERPGARAFADRFDLPDLVRQRLDDPDDPAAVVSALLTAGGRPAERHGDLVLSGEVAVVVAPVDDGGERSLSRAFLRIQESGAPYGLIIRLGYADPVLVHHREVSAPHVRHAPARSVQRMADAVALGEDPLAFALGPPVTH